MRADSRIRWSTTAVVAHYWGVPLYIVRWPDLTASIVRAADGDDLVDILDEVADPGCAQWEEYDGPLWVEFDSPFGVKVRKTKKNVPLRSEDVDVNTPAGFPEPETYAGDVLIPATSESDTFYEMRREVVERLFPHLAAALDEISDAEYDGKPLQSDEVETRLRAAFGRELEPMLKHSWRWQAVQRKGGIMALTGVTIPTSPMRDHEDEPDDDDDGHE